MQAHSAYPHEVPPSGPSAMFAEGLRARLPVLQTERLTLRAPVLEDFATYADILMSDRAAYMDGPFDRETAWLDFTSSVSNWLLRGHGPWTVTRSADATILGFVTVQMEWGDHEPELGFFFTAEAEGHGYAFEAARAARAHALNTLRLPKLVSYVDPANTRSRALAEKLGAKPDAAAAAKFEDHATDPVLVYRHEALQ